MFVKYSLFVCTCLEGGSGRIVTRGRLVNAGRDGVAMGMDSASGEKQKTGYSIYGQSNERCDFTSKKVNRLVSI